MKYPEQELIDYNLVSCQLIKAIRGKVSQTTLNNQLNYAVNQMYRWESGYRSISWQSFIKVCELRKLPIKKIIESEFGFYGNIYQTSEFVSHLKGPSSQIEFIKQSKFSKGMISKWLLGITEPNLHHILSLIESSHGILVEFIQKLVALEKVPTFKNFEKLYSLRKNIFYDHPEIGPIMACFDLPEFQKERPDILIPIMAKKLGLKRQYLEKCISKMIAAGFIELSKNKMSLSMIKFDTRGNAQGTILLRRYWLNYALTVLDRVPDVVGEDNFAHFTFSISEDGQKRLREATYEFFSIFRSIVESDKSPKSVIRNVSFQNLVVRGLQDS